MDLFVFCEISSGLHVASLAPSTCVRCCRWQLYINTITSATIVSGTTSCITSDYGLVSLILILVSECAACTYARLLVDQARMKVVITRLKPSICYVGMILRSMIVLYCYWPLGNQGKEGITRMVHLVSCHERFLCRRSTNKQTTRERTGK